MSAVDGSSGGKLLSRGAFLATGAAAAAGASVGALAAEPPLTRPGTTPCGKVCPPSREQWAIPAGILNTFWSDVYPRIVAEYWRQRERGGDPQLATWTKTEFEIATTQPAAGTTMTWPTFPEAVGEWVGSDLFLSRLEKVHAYLTSTRTIPITVIGEGEFDFILSDAGLELFVPPQPASRRDLLRYYTYRGTGRRAIGIPKYLSAGLEGMASAMSTDSPTGPSQILLNLATLEAYLSAAHPDMDACVQAVIQCLRTTHQMPSEEIVELVNLGILGQEDREPVMLSLEEYACAVRPLRCWQVAGAVYRGIMTELPRVVAAIWMEHADGVAGAGDSYASYFRSSGPNRPILTGSLTSGLSSDSIDLLAGDNNLGVRRVFRERLETSLPEDDEMRFRTYSFPRDNELGPLFFSPPSPNWVDGDVMITNRGFFLPRVDDDVPELEVMYQEIKDGRAGNPVFTDSVFCE